jgi:Rod binding domain-containing protein
VATAKAASDLEGVFLNLLWQQMWRTVTPGGQGSGSYLPGGLAGEISRDFLTQGFADKMADAGGIGLAALVKAQLSR